MQQRMVFKAAYNTYFFNDVKQTPCSGALNKAQLDYCNSRQSNTKGYSFAP